MPSVLNVGGGSKEIAIPEYFSGWDHLLLDISPAGNPDIVHDARTLDDLPPAQYDAIYCSHNLEHYYRHDAAKVLRGFLHVLKPNGFAHIRVPEIGIVMRRVVAGNLDIHDTLYNSPAGPITVHDVLYGFGKQIESSGVDFYAHKAGFTSRSLTEALRKAGFAEVYVVTLDAALEVQAVAFKSPPTPEQKRLFGL